MDCGAFVAVTFSDQSAEKSAFPWAHFESGRPFSAFEVWSTIPSMANLGGA